MIRDEHTVAVTMYEDGKIGRSTGVGAGRRGRVGEGLPDRQFAGDFDGAVEGIEEMAANLQRQDRELLEETFTQIVDSFEVG